MFVESVAVGAGLASCVYDFSRRCGRTATPDREAFRGVPFTTLFGQNNILIV